MRKIALSIMIFILSSLLFTIPAFAQVYTPVELTVEFKADKDKVIAIDYADGRETSDSAVIVSPETKYTLSFNEPGNYIYTLYDSKNTEDAYILYVAVTTDDNELTATLLAYRPTKDKEGKITTEKTTDLTFVTEKPTEPEKKAKSEDTGDRAKPTVYIVGSATLGLAIVIILVVLFKKKGGESDEK